MARSKHLPQRTCIICRTIKPKRDLLRIVRTPDQVLMLDQTGKMSGRGAYLCRDTICWQNNSLSRKHIQHALKLSISTENWSTFIDEISQFKLGEGTKQ